MVAQGPLEAFVMVRIHAGQPVHTENAERATFLKKLSLPILLLAGVARSALADTTTLQKSDWQPFTAQIRRLTEAMEFLGSPFDEQTQASLKQALAEGNITNASEKIQNALDAHCLFLVNIN